MRYRLQHKETFVLSNVLGNHSFPVYTYRWKDIAGSDDLFALQDMMNQCIPRNEYRIEDTQGGGQDGERIDF